MMDYQEGYCDGLSGAGMQDRDTWDYDDGFMYGSLDRKTMLHRETAFDRWADGLMNSTAGDAMQEWRNSYEPAAEAMARATDTMKALVAADVMQPVERIGVAGSDEYKKAQRAHNRKVSAEIDALNSTHGLWADGMGDGNA